MRFLIAALVLLPSLSSADKALGLHLLNNDFSLWKVRERSAWGLEIGGRASFGDDRQYHILRTGIVYQRFQATQRNVRPFMFTRLAGRSLQIDDRNMDYTATISLGLGLSWKPFERVGFWARRGVDFAYRDGGYENRSLNIHFGYHPRIIAFWIF